MKAAGERQNLSSALPENRFLAVKNKVKRNGHMQIYIRQYTKAESGEKRIF